MTLPQHSTSQKIIALLPQLDEGDRVRLLNLAEAMITQKRGKRKRRGSRRVRPIDDSWMIGN